MLSSNESINALEEEMHPSTTEYAADGVKSQEQINMESVETKRYDGSGQSAVSSVKSVLSTRMYSDDMSLPEYVTVELNVHGVPDVVVERINENPYLVTILSKRFVQFESFAIWMRKWGIRDWHSIAKMVLMRPKLMKASLAQMEKTILWYRRELSIPDVEVGVLIVKNPALLLFTAEEARDVFFAFENVGYARRHFRKFLIDNPGSITPDIFGRLDNVVVWFGQEMRLTVNKVKKALDRTPTILEKTRQQLDAYIDYFEHHLEMERTRIRSMVRMNPRWLGLDLERVIVPLTRGLIKDFDLTHKEVGRIIGMQPGLLVRPVENMYRTRELLIGSGLSPNDVKIIISRAPSAFFIHADRTTQPLLSYILETMHRTPREIVEFPYCLTYPIETLMVRVGFLGPFGQKKISLKQLLKPPDHIFAEVVANSKRTTYSVFKQSWKVPKEWEEYIAARDKQVDFED